MRSLGTRPRPLGPIYDSTRTTIREHIASLEEGVYSYTWQVEESKRRAATRRTAAWARREIGPLDRAHVLRRRIVPRAYDLP
jgi:hypothetical protein